MDGGIRPGTGRLDGKALTGRFSEQAVRAAEAAAETVKAQAAMAGDQVASSLDFEDNDFEDMPELPDPSHISFAMRGRNSGGGGSGGV